MRDSFPTNSALAAILLRVNKKPFIFIEYSLGAYGDSFYEYLLKMQLLVGPKAEVEKKMLDKALKVRTLDTKIFKRRL